MLFHKSSQKPFMLLSLPNSGSDWMMKNICDTHPDLRYSREFFNPICNPNYEKELTKIFGCEEISNLKKIAESCSLEDYLKVFSKTWEKEKFRATKENYSAFKMKFHAIKFNCCVLYRKYNLCFPGERKEKVASWYDSMFQSLIENELPQDIKPFADHVFSITSSTEEKQIATHTIYYYQTIKTACELNIPILDYDDLIFANETKLLSKVEPLNKLVNPKFLVKNILKTRKEKETSLFGEPLFFQKILDKMPDENIKETYFT